MQWGVVATDTAAYRQDNRNTNPTKEANIAIAMWQPYTDNGIYAIDNSGGTYGDKLTLSNGAPANGDIFGFVYDAGAGKFYVFFKGVEPTGQNYSAGTTLFDTLDTSKTYALHNCEGDGGSSTKSGNFVMNFGQDSSFAGAKTAQGNKDASGIGDFYYSVPSGAKALCSKNLPDPTILLPNKHFETLIYTGNSTNNRSITGLEFKPDWLWFKKRDGSSNMSHYLVRSLRAYTDSGSGNGNNGAFISGTNTDEAEGETSDGGFESFDSNGFTLGKGSNDANSDSAYQRNNANGGGYVVWAWDAGETDSATYTVKVVSDSGNKYRFNDFGSSAVTLDLAEGGTYTFDQSDSSMSSHPMQLSTTANGTHGGGSAYSTGVTYQLDGATVTASAFISGFSSASSRKLIITVAASAPTLYYYCYYHSGMGGQANTNSTTGSSNFDGTTQAVVKANPTAGFSMIQYTGNGTNSSTVGHGLGVTPDAVIVKRRNGSDGSWIFESPHSYNGYGMYLDSTNGSNTAGSDTTSRSATTLVTFVNSSDTNRRVNINGETYVMYVFALMYLDILKLESTREMVWWTVHTTFADSHPNF